MQLTLNKYSALYLMRLLRVDRTRSNALFRRTDIVSPNPFPLQRWGKTSFAGGNNEMLGLLQGETVYAAVPSGDARLQSKRVANTVYGPGIPNDSFVDVGHGIAISGPELLFVEMAPLMHPIEHLMLGHELCGSFGRSAKNPRNGDVVYSLPPLTNVKRIGEFLEHARGINGIARARASLARLNDNAWSPTESLIASFLRTPIDDMGFGFGPLVLNDRVYRETVMPDSRDSRVPDILIRETKVGLNYDGLVHLDLDSIARAAFELGANPGAGHAEIELNRAMNRVRAKVLDDIRRNRELSANGYTVFPVLKEDLYQAGGLDTLVARLVNTLERESNLDLWEPKRALASKALSEDRFLLLSSLLPGKYEPDAELGRYIAGYRISEAASLTSECWVEF